MPETRHTPSLHDEWVEDPLSAEFGEKCGEADDFIQDTHDWIEEMRAADLLDDTSDLGREIIDLIVRAELLGAS